jgi:hypothetical protein
LRRKYRYKYGPCPRDEVDAAWFVLTGEAPVV